MEKKQKKPKSNRKPPKTLPKVRVSDIDQTTFTKEEMVPDPYWEDLYK